MFILDKVSALTLREAEEAREIEIRPIEPNEDLFESWKHMLNLPLPLPHSAPISIQTLDKKFDFVFFLN